MVTALDYTTYKRSIALCISDTEEKVYYLDFEEKVLIGEPFTIRTIALAKKPQQNYLLLLLSNERAIIFLGNGIHIQQLVSNQNHFIIPEGHTGVLRSPIATKQSVNETGVKEFIRYIDNRLTIVLNSYPYPFFIL